MRRVGFVAIATLVACERDRGKPPLPPLPTVESLPALSPPLEADAPAEDAPQVTIGFNWGAPCRVPAQQDVEQDGARARFAFDVTLERTDGRLVARLENSRLVAAPIGGPHSEALQRATTALGGAVPPIAVTDTGESDGALEIDKAIDSALTLVAKNVNDPQATATLAATLRTPQFKAAFAQKAGETWDVWIGAWTGMELVPGSSDTVEIDLPSVFGTFEGVPVTTAHHGTVRGAPNLILVSMEQTLEGPQLAKMIGGFAQSISGQDIEIKDARKVDRTLVALDPVLGRTHRSRHEVDSTFETRRKHTIRDTAFDWSKAVGCKPGGQ